MGTEDNDRLGIVSLAERLFPMMRSVAGPGLRTSIQSVSALMPMRLHEVPSGTDIFDWTVPKEWSFESATIRDSLGAVILDAAENNLHVLNFSDPIQASVSGEELKKHLYFENRRPHAIPYRTSYYEATWGFCCTKPFFDAIEDDGSYLVEIECSKLQGSLTVGEAVIQGESDTEVVFSSYLCHPQMAVNELSGPLSLAHLYRLLTRKRRRFTYRFFLSSETIGSLATISLFMPRLKAKMMAGAMIHMTGLNSPVVHRLPRDQTALDQAIQTAARLSSIPADNVLPWSPIGGGDQRQWTSNGVSLPMSYVSRTIGGGFPQYHTSDDDLDLLNFDNVLEVAELLEAACEIVEENNRYRYVGPPGEPFFSKRDLVPSIGGPKGTEERHCLTAITGCSDGSATLLDIAIKYNLPWEGMVAAASKLEKVGLIRRLSGVTNG